MSNMYNIIENLCKSNNMTVTEMCRELKITRSSLSELKQGRAKSLSADKVIKIAKYFGVSTDYILLGEKSVSISQEDQDILKLFHQLPHDAQLEFRGELKGYIKCLKRQEEDAAEPLKKAK